VILIHNWRGQSSYAGTIDQIAASWGKRMVPAPFPFPRKVNVNPIPWGGREQARFPQQGTLGGHCDRAEYRDLGRGRPRTLRATPACTNLAEPASCLFEIGHGSCISLL